MSPGEVVQDSVDSSPFLLAGSLPPALELVASFVAVEEARLRDSSGQARRRACNRRGKGSQLHFPRLSNQSTPFRSLYEPQPAEGNSPKALPQLAQETGPLAIRSQLPPQLKGAEPLVSRCRQTL